METGFRPPGFDTTKPEGEKALRIAMDSFNVMPDGRVEMKPDVYRAAQFDKDFGITDGEWVLNLVMVAGRKPLLISLHVPTKRWDVYPTDVALPSPPPLLPQACNEPLLSDGLTVPCKALSR